MQLESLAITAAQQHKHPASLAGMLHESSRDCSLALLADKENSSTANPSRSSYKHVELRLLPLLLLVPLLVVRRNTNSASGVDDVPLFAAGTSSHPTGAIGHHYSPAINATNTSNKVDT